MNSCQTGQISWPFQSSSQRYVDGFDHRARAVIIVGAFESRGTAIAVTTANCLESDKMKSHGDMGII